MKRCFAEFGASKVWRRIPRLRERGMQLSVTCANPKSPRGRYLMCFGPGAAQLLYDHEVEIISEEDTLTTRPRQGGSFEMKRRLKQSRHACEERTCSSRRQQGRRREGTL